MIDEFIKPTPIKNNEEKNTIELERNLQSCIQTLNQSLDILENEIKIKEKITQDLFNNKKID